MFKHFLESAKWIKQYNKGILVVLILRSLITSIAPLFNTIITGLLIDSLFLQKNVRHIIIVVSTMIITNLVFALINIGLNSLLSVKRFYIDQHYQMAKTKAYMRVDYAMVENSEFTDLRQNIIYSDDNMGTFSSMVDTISGCFDNILSILTSFVVLVVMIISIISHEAMALWAILLFTVSVFLCTFGISKLSKSKQSRSANVLSELFDSMSKENRLAMYLADRIVFNYEMGKDIRIYDAEGIINKEFDCMIKRTKGLYKNICFLSNAPRSITDAGTNLLGGVIYIFLAFWAAIGYITIGNIIIYANNVQRFVSAITSFSLLSGELSVLLSRLSLTKQLFELETNSTDESELHNDIIAKPDTQSIVFKNVWFKYPKCDKYTLEDISFTICSGERISIVGENGAGKSTIVKLLCKLYRPDKGNIYINGVDIWDVPNQDYKKMVSAIFQNFKLLSFSIGENLSLEDNYNSELAMEVLAKLGLDNKIKGLPQGLDSILFHDYEENGIECSGGELQKIALARCLYSKSSILVLDEPTASLDPCGEAEVFENFNLVSENKIVIYISHRLSSCKFCDRILVIKDGKIVQEGHHNDLILQPHSIYRKFWDAQSQYYQ